MKKLILILFPLILTGFQTFATSHIALVYKGPGSCKENCSESAAFMAQAAGYTPRFVGPNETSTEVFRNAAVWIQPGGVAGTAAEYMAPELKDNLREFIGRGGGFVGFCAGGFIATEMIGDGDLLGLDILPGNSVLYSYRNHVGIIPIKMGNKTRHIYWEGGPYFQVNASEQTQAEAMAYYPDSSIASIRAPFGRGRVYVTGLHPEAPQKWRDYYKLQDADGVDDSVAVDMILWSTKSH